MMTILLERSKRPNEENEYRKKGCSCLTPVTDSVSSYVGRETESKKLDGFVNYNVEHEYFHICVSICDQKLILRTLMYLEIATSNYYFLHRLRSLAKTSLFF